MDEQQIAAYLGNLSSALLHLSMMIRQMGSDELKAYALPLLEGPEFGHDIPAGIFDVVKALREEFPEDEDESDEEESEEDQD